MLVLPVLFCGLLLVTSSLGQNVAPEPQDLAGRGFGEDEGKYWNTGMVVITRFEWQSQGRVFLTR